MARKRDRFDIFLWDSFSEGRTTRELRLSGPELMLLRETYPWASYVASSDPQADGTCWYCISLALAGAAQQYKQ